MTMDTTRRTRNANGRSSIYYSERDGSWHGWVTVGVKDNGRPDRRHVRGQNKATVTKKVRDLERQRDSGAVRKAGHNWTVAQWLDHWLHVIVAPPVITENAWSAYEIAVRCHLTPGIGAHRLDRLAPEHLERLYRKMVTAGAKPGYAHQVHRTVRAALNEAVRRKHLTSNPATVARAPKLEEEEVEPFTVDEIKRVIRAARLRRNGARWAVALALGLRQGEALGLMWSDVDLDTGTLVVARSRVRPTWRHGCSEPCGHKHGGHCPERVSTRNETAGTKSKAGRRGMGLPDQLIALLKEHRQQQDREREVAAELWRESGYLFTNPTGQPLHPRTDHREWKDLLVAADVSERRLHDARHTAATVLLLLGVPERAVMGVMGWSNTAMAARYQHIVAAVRRDVATRVDGLLWEADPTEEDRERPDGALN